MKHALAVAAIAALLSQPAFAQAITAAQVPAAVKRAVQAKFPGAGAIEWKLKSDKNYEAEFKLRGVDIAAKFDSTAKWLETETTVAQSAIPAAVRDTIATNFKGYKIVETQTLQRWNEQSVVYELHVENAKEIVKTQYNARGAILSRSAKPKP